MCVFEIRFAEGVEEDLRNIRIYYRNQILDAIEKQLVHEPDTRTRNRKLLENLIPPWQMVAPIWELRVGEYRVFYDISETESLFMCEPFEESHEEPRRRIFCEDSKRS